MNNYLLMQKYWASAVELSFKHAKKIKFLSLLLLLAPALWAQQTITGRVTSGDSAITQATVVVKGSTTATQTDANGNFTISAPVGATLTISHVGYLAQDVKVPKDGSVNVLLKQSVATNMSEVVVVGYGSQKRSDVTGSVASVPKNRLTQLPVTNIMQAIQGSVAGVNVTTPSQVPGRTASIQIRGINSIGASSSPLIVVDGVPLSPDASTNDINSNDVASMEILKDASATAIYGVRGSNGVILITTKRGSSGKPIIRYNTYYGVERVINSLHPGTPEQYVQKYKDYKAQNGLSDTSILPNIYERNNYYASLNGQFKPVNWVDLVTQTGTLQDHNLSISGGTKDAKYYLSGEYLRQKGAVKGYQYQRINLRSNLDVNLTDWLSAGTSFFFNNNNTDGGRANFFFGSTLSPYGTVYNATGGYEIYPMYGELLYTNPLLGLTTERIERSNNLTGTGYFEVKPGGAIKGLKYRMNASYAYVTGRNGSYEGRSVNNQLGSANVSNTESKYWIIENILSYAKDWNRHHIDFTGLYSSQEKTWFQSNGSATGFINDQLSFYNLGAGASQGSGSYSDKKNTLSQMGRVNYSYDSRYLFTVTARRDGSSPFGANTSKYGVFPSVAFGWNITNERFMEPVQAINNLKFRASYGKTGNEAVPVNRTVTTAGTNRFPFNGNSTIGVLASNLGNKNLHWEETVGINSGIDFSLFRNRLSGTIDGWHTTTSDIVLQRNIPIITGYSSIYDNLGKTRNVGVEVTLNSVNVNTGDFKWETSLNFSTYKNTIIRLYGNFDSLGNEISDIGQGLFIGRSRYVVYDYTLLGVWQEKEIAAGDHLNSDPTAKAGYLKFADLNGDKKIDANDKSVLGSRLPKIAGGLTNTFHYKNFHLNIFLQGSYGALRNNGNFSFADEGWRINIPREIGYWTAANPINDRPSFNAQAISATRGYGYPKKSNYTRIKDVTLSYTASSSLLDKLRLGSLTIYASGRNLYTFTNWVGWDPEQDFSFRGSGDWTNNYPPVRSVVLGANISLR